jgi:uncharacterized protein (UPF0276 family)
MISSDGTATADLVGVGLRAPHVAGILATRPAIGWLEVHTENYLGGGPDRRALDVVRQHYPVSLHGVGLSLGSAEGLDPRHLARVVSLVERVEPVRVSEHLSWSATDGAYLNHLLPLPYTEESLTVVCRNVSRVQEALGRAVLIENPASYLRFRHSPIPEPQFLGELSRRSGCGILCDVNNIFVTSQNLDQDAGAYLAALPGEAVGEIHLAGHCRNDVGGRTILIDDHGSPVSPHVWALYEQAVARFGPRPTLIEWDTDIPELTVLLAEAHTAEEMLRHDVAA